MKEETGLEDRTEEKSEIMFVCVNCKAIKIPNSDAWLREETDSELYAEYNMLLQEKLKDLKVSHGYCPMCAEKAYREWNF